MAELSAASVRIIEVLRKVPFGKVASYGRIASLAGIPNGARAVVRVLHACSAKYDLPWHRVIRADGTIALCEDGGGAMQITLLKQEGVKFLSDNRVDLAACVWDPH